MPDVRTTAETDTDRDPETSPTSPAIPSPTSNTDTTTTAMAKEDTVPPGVTGTDADADADQDKAGSSDVASPSPSTERPSPSEPKPESLPDTTAAAEGDAPRLPPKDSALTDAKEPSGDAAEGTAPEDQIEDEHNESQHARGTDPGPSAAAGAVVAPSASAGVSSSSPTSLASPSAPASSSSSSSDVPKIITSPVDEEPSKRVSTPTPAPTTDLTKSQSPTSPASSSSSTSAPHSPTPTPPAELNVARPPRRSSLMSMHPKSMLTPAPARAITPPAPVKPPAPTSTRVAADLEEFDPFATPAPPPAPAPAVPPKDRSSSGSGSSSGGQGERVSPGAGAGAGARGGRVSPGAGAQGGRASPGGQRQQLAPPVGGHRRSGSRADDEPQFNFAGFLRDLRTKPADPVARYLKSFLTNFSRKPFTVNEQIKLIRDFLAFIAEKMRLVEPWKSQSAAEFDNAIEAMEKLVMNRLYPYTFTPQLTGKATITTDDLERDAVFAQRVRLFTWVKEKHLDVPEGEQSAGFLAFAEQELLKINHYKAPRDKMICILNCCKVIFGLIRHTQGNEAGADAFVPILIFVVLRANPDNMLSNVEYINRFRNPEKLSGEAGYYLSSLQGAIAFIETMDASALSNITQEEFESNVEQAIRELPSSPTSPRVESAPGTGGSDMSPFATSPGEEPARPLTMPATAAALDGTKRFFQRTGDAAKEAVSRPLSAIGKILETMQAAAESESGEDDSDDERDRQQWQGKQTPSGGHVRSSSQAQPPSRLLAQLGLSPGGSESVTPTARTPTPEAAAYHAHMQAQQAAMFQQHTPTGTPTPQYGYPGQYAREASQTPTASPYVGEGSPMTPAQVHAQQQYYAQQLAVQQHIAAQQQQVHNQQMATTLEASQEAYAREQARLANVTTLHQMFPALGEEIVDSVLYSCGDDLGLAIDRLLEM